MHPVASSVMPNRRYVLIMDGWQNPTVWGPRMTGLANVQFISAVGTCQDVLYNFCISRRRRGHVQWLLYVNCRHELQLR